MGRNRADPMGDHTMADEGLPLGALTPLVETGLCWVGEKGLSFTKFELRAGEDIVARLRFSDAAGSVAIGESARGDWIFANEGLMKPCITVRSMADQVALAVYKPRLVCLPGTVEFLDGRRFCWRRIGLFPAAYRFDDAEGKPLMVIRFRCCRSWLFGPREFRGLVKIEPHAYAVSELMPLLLLSWYLVVLQRNKGRLEILP
jgi:hypothetical protein